MLALNPDCRLEPRLRGDARATPRRAGLRRVGSASGRLFRAEGPELPRAALLDSAGIVFTASGRHFDRGRGRAGRRPFDGEEEIAGASGRGRLLPPRGPRGRARSRRDISTRTSSSTARTRTSRGDCASLGWQCLYVPVGRRCAPPAQHARAAAADVGPRQHALGQEPVPAADQQPDRGRVALVDAASRRSRAISSFSAACLTVERTSLAGLRLALEESEEAVGQAPGDPGEGRGEEARTLKRHPERSEGCRTRHAYVPARAAGFLRRGSSE